MEIQRKRLEELERIEKFLNALKGGGVDNWDGYDDALVEYRKDNETEDKEETE